MSEKKSTILTKEVTKNKQHLGWKVYIDGQKYPKKPMDYYEGLTEGAAVMKALEEYNSEVAND